MSNDTVRKSTSAIIGEIRAAEAEMNKRGFEIADEDEWMQLRDIVARIERKLAANSKDTAA